MWRWPTQRNGSASPTAGRGIWPRPRPVPTRRWPSSSSAPRVARGRAEGSRRRAAFLRRAVALTVEPTRRGERALAAAQANFEAGAFDVARGLVATAETGALDEFQRAR